jgi:hypothetical protein
LFGYISFALAPHLFLLRSHHQIHSSTFYLS